MANAIPENSPKEKKPKDQQTEMQNGSAMSHVDRYGFMKGDQYTNPDQ
jgi:hypothetical protein